MKTYREFLRSKIPDREWFGFEPLWMPDFLFDFQKYLVDWAVRGGKAAIYADCGLGKGQPATAPVLTPSGWVSIGSLTVGDFIIASNGKPYPVVGVYRKPVQDTYRFHYSDGASLVVDLDHLHICRTNNDRQRNRPWRVMSTADLLTCGNLRYGHEGKSRNYDIPVVADVEFDWVELPIDPYVLGVLLGDGHLKGNISISSADAELLAVVADRLPVDVSLAQKSKYDWKVITGLTGCRRHPFRQIFHDLGILGKLSADKFIPQQFLFGSPAERLELLRGLMDTDGYVGPGGTCQFYSVSSQLASGVVHLVRSLGGVPTETLKQTSCNGKPGQPCHVVTFSLTTHNPFLLSRKAKRWNPNPRDNGRWIDRIEFEKRQPTVCISVASPDSSYVTDHFIVTHNTPMQLVWAENVVRKTNGRVLVLTPLAVSAQTVREGAKFGIECRQSRDGRHGKGITVTNYEKLHLFDPADFTGVVVDESGCIKHFTSQRQKGITQFMGGIKYRLLCTATPAPNDYMELGTSSEALGRLGRMDMLATFFKNDEDSLHPIWWGSKWRLKKHSETAFWRWVCSWARAVRRPSDLGFDDGKFQLPPLEIKQTVIEATTIRRKGFFARPAKTLEEQRAERKGTVRQRCEKVAELVGKHRPALVWCHLNQEGDLLEELIPGAVQVAGSDSDEAKEERFLAFADGQIKALVTKPKIGGFGMNWQNCSFMTFFPSHSYEQWYQSVRRCWRFGQKNPVTVQVVTTPGESNVLRNLQRKSEAAAGMFEQLVAEMKHGMEIKTRDDAHTKLEKPSWL